MVIIEKFFDVGFKKEERSLVGSIFEEVWG